MHQPWAGGMRIWFYDRFGHIHFSICPPMYAVYAMMCANSCNLLSSQSSMRQMIWCFRPDTHPSHVKRTGTKHGNMPHHGPKHKLEHASVEMASFIFSTLALSCWVSGCCSGWALKLTIVWNNDSVQWTTGQRQEISENTCSGVFWSVRMCTDELQLYMILLFIFIPFSCEFSLFHSLMQVKRWI